MPILLKGEAHRRAASVGPSLVWLLGDGRRPLHGADTQKVANHLLLISHIKQTQCLQLQRDENVSAS